jgi:hypothetical protein
MMRKFPDDQDRRMFLDTVTLGIEESLSDYILLAQASIFSSSRYA